MQKPEDSLESLEIPKPVKFDKINTDEMFENVLDNWEKNNHKYISI